MSKLFQHDGINIWKSTFPIFPAAYTSRLWLVILTHIRISNSINTVASLYRSRPMRCSLLTESIRTYQSFTEVSLQQQLGPRRVDLADYDVPSGSVGAWLL